MLWEAIASFVLAGLAILVTFGYRHAAHERSPASLAPREYASPSSRSRSYHAAVDVWPRRKLRSSELVPE